ncbi:hypothetical protein [Dyella tabacisoli]|uniref:Uncharacterized protein n=1 Tax=Dyella tabacisoli TaxID=2282381 RepID=A0A369URA6_9GAMM|nr:hypothetical protein [Dyella tabacisoli]RDD83186.1 hypothetical protein DVJ77_00845 [Dyella tabacisoli]
MMRYIALSAGLLVATMLGAVGPAHADAQSCSLCRQHVQDCIVAGERPVQCEIEFNFCVSECASSVRNDSGLTLAPIKPVSPAIPRDQRLVAGLKSP